MLEDNLISIPGIVSRVFHRFGMDTIGVVPPILDTSDPVVKAEDVGGVLGARITPPSGCGPATVQANIKLEPCKLVSIFIDTSS